MEVTVLIPAYNPDPSLLSLVGSLIRLGFKSIVIVNDGSKPEYNYIFNKLEAMVECHVLHHAVNLGKGRALKTGFNYIYLNFTDVFGVVTADADGQHLPGDVFKVAQTFLSKPDTLVIGSRKFRKDMPFRSYIGNVTTKHVFRLLMGKKVADPQSGLRCIPRKTLPAFMRLSGEGYEYEMNMLMSAKQSKVAILEEPITTVYIDDNRSSHFNPLIDSMKIYFLLLRYSLSSLLASLLDFVVFMISYAVTSNVLVSIFVGRFTIGLFVNFVVNKNFVFHHRGNTVAPLVKYYLFATIMGIVASVLIQRVADKFLISVILSKVLVESFLFFVSFVIQRDYIFTNKGLEELQE